MIEFNKVKIDSGMEINKYFEEELKKNIEDVFCCHCGKRFLANELKIIKDKLSKKKIIVCKYYPECDGELWDLFFGEDGRE